MSGTYALDEEIQHSKGSNTISTLSAKLQDKELSINDGKGHKHADKTISPPEKYTAKQKMRNLLTAVCLVGTVIAGNSIYGDAHTQWQYYRFQERALGANFSQLNVSAHRNPCLSSKSEVNPFADKLNEAQTEISKFGTYISLVSVIPCFLTLLLFGASTGRIGRKVFFVVPVTGLFLECFINWVVCYWHFEIEWVLLGAVVNGFCGSYGGLFMALYTYTADCTDSRGGRSLGMVVVGAINGFFFSISHVAVGYVILEYGYMWPMAVGTMIVFLGLVGIILFVKETLQVPKDRPAYSVIEGVKSLFTFFIKAAPGSKFKRKDFIIIVFAFVLILSAHPHGMGPLFLLNEPFCWNSKMLGIVATVIGISTTVSNIVFQKILQRHLSDEKIAIISILSGVVNRVIFAFAQNDWMIYVARIVGMLEHISLHLMRAILTRMVPPNKRGALMSSLAVLDVIFISMSNIGVTQLYAHTVAYWKGLTYFVLALFTFVPVVLMIVFAYLRNKREAAWADREAAMEKNKGGDRTHAQLDTAELPSVVEY